MSQTGLHSVSNRARETSSGSGSERGDENQEITSLSAASPSQCSLHVGGIAAIRKRDREYPWVRYAEDERILVKRPVAVCVE